MQESHSRTHHLILITILLAAFALRAITLDAQSFWSDEGISLLRSSLPLAEMLREMPVEHMPGYFVLLHVWLQLSGSLDFGIRFLSLFPSVLAVSLVYSLGRSLGGPSDDSSAAARISQGNGTWAGTVAATLLATAGFQIWYAQEARMYSWLLSAGLAAHLFLWRFLHSRNPIPALIGYILATTLSVYLHFYGFLVPLAHAAYMMGWTVATRRWRALGMWAAAGGVILFLFLPWLPRALGIFEFSGWRADGDPWQIPQLYFAAYTVGDSLLPPWRDGFLWLYLALTSMGISSWLMRRRRAGLYLLTLMCVPMVAVIGLAVNNPDFHPRYAIVVSAILPLLVGGAVSFIRVPRLPRWLVPVTVTAFLLIGNGMSVQRQFTDRSMHKPDFRGAAYRIAVNEKPGDTILVDGPDPEKVFLHYYTGSAPVHDLRSLADEDWEKIQAALRDKVGDSTRIWELLYFHGPGPVQTWTAINGWATTPTDHNDIRITLYGTERNVQEDSVSSQLNIDFGTGLRLLDAHVNGTIFTTDDLVQVTTVWHVAEQLPDYKFSLRLLTDEGGVLRSWDYIPQNWIAPTSMWIVGNQATDQHGFLIDPGIAPGTYQLALRLYNPADGVAVETGVGQDVVLHSIQVEAQ